jgi:hypothetical protein
MFARQNRGRAAAGNLATTRPRRRAARPWQSLPFAIAALLAGAVALPQPALGATAATNVTFTKLTLLHGWGKYSGSATPAIADISGTVYFKGAISTSSNTNNVAFVLPPGFRPAKYVNVPVDMCNATSGELNIAPTGVTEVISQGANSNATCFTSLDGVSFALSSASFTALKLKPGWTEFDNLFRKAAVRVAGGIVHLEGEIKTAGTNPAALGWRCRWGLCHAVGWSGGCGPLAEDAHDRRGGLRLVLRCWRPGSSWPTAWCRRSAPWPTPTSFAMSAGL